MLSMFNEKIINLNKSVLGFEELSQFMVNIVEEDSPYAFLNSVTEEDVGFLIASPFTFFTDFTFELAESTIKELKIESPEDVLVMGIITISNPFIQSTMNLLAPIVINVRNLHGRQIVLPSEYNYSTKTRLFKEMIVGGGE